MSISYWLNTGLNILILVCILFGFWIARKSIPKLLAWVSSADPDESTSHPVIKVILWITTGAFFSLPLVDLINWLGDWLNITLTSPNNNVTTNIGVISTGVYSAFLVLLLLVVYGGVYYIGIDFLPKSDQFTRIERFFIELGVASLILHLFQVFFSRLISIQLPILNQGPNYGAPGFIIEIVIGVVVFGLVLFVIDQFHSQEHQRGI